MRCLVIATTLVACGPAPAPAPLHATAPHTADPIERARAEHGVVLLVAREDEIAAVTPALEPVRVIAHRRGHAMQVIDHVLYALGDRELFAVDLRTGETRTLAKLPPLHHKCFDGDDPTASLEQGTVPLIDLKRGVACMRIQDRNDNMMSVAIEYRIDLHAGTSVQRTTFTLDDCREPGETKEDKSPCEPTAAEAGTAPERDTAPHHLAEIGRSGIVSASGRWALFDDDALGAEGDYIYSSVLVFDGKTGKTYAVTPTGLVPLDLAAAVAAQKAPPKTCMVPAEYAARWIDHTDLLAVPNCGDGTLLLDPATGTARTLPTLDFVAY